MVSKKDGSFGVLRVRNHRATAHGSRNQNDAPIYRFTTAKTFRDLKPVEEVKRHDGLQLGADNNQNEYVLDHIFCNESDNKKIQLSSTIVASKNNGPCSEERKLKKNEGSETKIRQSLARQ